MGKRKPRKKVEYKDAGDRFRQISNRRAKTLVKQSIMVNRMLPQPSYAVSPEDAKKLLDYINKHIEPLITNLTKIAEGQPLRGKQEINNVYVEG